MLFLLLAVATPAVAAQGSPIGLWINQDGSALVRIAPCEENRQTLCGHIEKILDMSEVGAVDENNPDRTLRSRRLEGLEVLWHFTPLSNTVNWIGGSAYDPDEGRKYSNLVLSLKDSKHLILAKPLRLMAFQTDLSAETWTRFEK